MSIIKNTPWRVTPKGNHRKEIGKFELAVFRHHTGRWGWKAIAENDFYNETFATSAEARDSLARALADLSLQIERDFSEGMKAIAKSEAA
jgi:hypothetical protein